MTTFVTNENSVSIKVGNSDQITVFPNNYPAVYKGQQKIYFELNDVIVKLKPDEEISFDGDTFSGDLDALETAILAVFPDANPSSGGPGYLVYTALVYQTGTDAPESYEILQNTLGGTPPVWTYGGIGYFILTLDGAFPEGKTCISITNGKASFAYIFAYSNTSPNSIAVGTKDYNNTEANNLLDETCIEIRVYP
jgi:hypothetical protein